MKTIKVTVKNGVPTIETSGFVGTECLEATRNVEALLSGDEGVEVRDMHGNLVEDRVDASY